jgi:hypothetical protein
VYILNRISSKVLFKTPFELWKGSKPSLNHTHLCGCFIEVKTYNPQLNKLDLKTTSGYFIGYAMNSKGYKFYCPSHSTRVVEARNATFFEDLNFSGSDFPRMIEFEKIQDLTELCKDKQQMIIVQENHLYNFKQ